MRVNKLMIQLSYIHHDCFILRTEKFSVIFDYWRMPIEAEASSPLHLVDKTKPVYVLVSHFHKDHFNPEIFSWRGECVDVRYILSADTARHARKYIREDSIYRGPLRIGAEGVTVLKAGESFSDDLIKVEAFGSTDIGNSYMLTLGSGRKVFHAGDLNAWVWRDDSTPEEIEQALSDYQREIEAIHRCHDAIDLAMFPVDSRIGSGYAEGASIFVRVFDVGIFVPMHFGLGADAAEMRKYLTDAVRFETYANTGRGGYAALTGYLSGLYLPW